jgi:hypothetical protein
MFISSWLPWRLARQNNGRPRPLPSRKAHRRGKRLAFEHLEDRTLLSNWTAASVADLIADINAGNKAGGSNTIALVAGSTFTLTAVNNTTDGATGLPVIAANNNLTIVGNGDTIARSTASGTPNFRLVDVALGASLTLENLTLQGGCAGGAGKYGEGGAILNQGTLTLSAVAVTGNDASGVRYPSGLGGGIYSTGSLTVEGGSLITNNGAYGGVGLSYRGVPPWYGPAYGGGVYVASGTASLDNVTLSSNTARGGSAYGGGLYVAGGTVTLANVTLSSNTAAGRNGNAYGGAVYVAGGTVTLTGDTLSSNSAVGGAGAQGPVYIAPGNGYGGAVYVAGGAVTLTGDTLSSNTAVGGVGGTAPSGTGGNGGNGYGGALYAAGGRVTLRNDTMSANSAQGGTGGTGASKAKNGRAGLGQGGGLYIASAAALSLDAFTLSHTTGNKPDDIYGQYTLIA